MALCLVGEDKYGNEELEGPSSEDWQLRPISMRDIVVD